MHSMVLLGKRKKMMAARNILIYGEKTLRQKCEMVETINQEVLSLIDDIKQTILSASGAGLAAPQVGCLKRVIVVKASDKIENSEMFALINPEILDSEGSIKSDEGCLSIPGVTETVERAERVIVNFQTETGEIKTIDTIGFLSRVLQHEIDHLNGILFVDRLGIVKRDMIKRKLKKRFSKKERVQT